MNTFVFIGLLKFNILVMFNFEIQIHNSIVAYNTGYIISFMIIYCYIVLLKAFMYMVVGNIVPCNKSLTIHIFFAFFLQIFFGFWSLWF